uniref:Uncharacterized protein n=1 Tax=Glossina palpalis gambiensis TaxID=67801 RepID=A0A1B0AM34_9MUSC
MYHLVDYIHLMHSIYYIMARNKELFDTSIVTRAHAGKLSTSNYLKRRGACLINTAAASLKECMQLLTPATVADLDVAVQRKIIYKEKDLRTYEVIAALTALCEVMHTGEISSAQWEGQKAVLAKRSTKHLIAPATCFTPLSTNIWWCRTSSSAYRRPACHGLSSSGQQDRAAMAWCTEQIYTDSYNLCCCLEKNFREEMDTNIITSF